MNTEFLQNGAVLSQKDGLFPLCTDAVVLAAFAQVPDGSRVCDLCCGGGAVGLLLLSRCPQCRVTGVDILPQACALARQNAAHSALRHPMEVVEGDLRQIRRLLPANQFDHVVCNPPYFPVNAGAAAKNPALAIARTELSCTLADVCAAAAWLLPTGGSVSLVHRPERLVDVLCQLRQHGLEPKLLRFVRHKAQHPVCLLLVKATLGGKPGLSYLPDLIQFEADGRPTAEYQRIYHQKEARP